MAESAALPASMLLRRSLLRAGALSLLLVIGGVVTWVWFSRTATPVEIGPLVPALLGTIAYTAGNLLLRWLRWHFLARRLESKLSAKDSLRIWFATLPALLTPFYVGELVRGAFLGDHTPRALRRVSLLWLIERGCDAVTLAAFWCFTRSMPLAAAALLLGAGGGAFLLFRHRLGRSSARQSGGFAAVTVGLSVAAWALPAAALWSVIGTLGHPVGLAAATEAFAAGTLAGGITGIPLGIGVTGSVSILSLLESGGAGVVASLAVFRAGTAWFSVLLGGVLAWFWRHELRRLWRRQPTRFHFDELADDYEEQIPEHIRTRLLDRKVRMMLEALPGQGAGLRGLDVGCGHGWYACALADAGCRMTGIDLASEQIANARRHAAARGLEIDLKAVSATGLPFDDASFDFAYAINVMHHIEESGAQTAAFAEILRVLKPGGRFFLHEINIENPLFRFYMGYVFPVIRDIDEGTERWIRPSRLPELDGGRWQPAVRYFTFLPDFIPVALMKRLAGLERWLESSFMASWSAHYLAVLERAPSACGPPAPAPAPAAPQTTAPTPPAPPRSRQSSAW